MTLGICLFCIALIARGCVCDARCPSHAIALIAFFTIMFAEAADVLHQQVTSGVHLNWMVGISLPLVPALGGCMWFYVRGLTSSDQRFTRRDLWHALPVVVIVGCTIPFLVLPPDQRQLFVTQNIDMGNLHQVSAVIFMMLGWIAWLAILVLYCAASLRRLLKHRARVRELFSNVEGVSLAWVYVLIVIVFTFTGLAIIGALLPAATGVALLAGTLTSPFYFCLVFVVGVFGVLQKSVIPPWSERDSDTEVRQKYERSALQKTDMLRIAAKLDERMRHDQLWQNPSLSLQDFSRATGVSQNNISQTLNDHLGKNFYDYVNGWRIDAACETLRTTDLSVLTILLDVGFNAKSTFNVAFKKVTGQTPRQFRNDAHASTKATSK